MFDEIYGSYYKTVENIIQMALSGRLDKAELQQAVEKEAFGESVVAIPDALSDGSWPLIDENYKTVIENVPKKPLTSLQKRWIKAILADPRVQLFDPPMEGFNDVEPLYKQDTFVFYDRYMDGDDFTNESYISNFRTVRKAIREKKWLLIRFYGRRERKNSGMFMPCQLEYSSKDDKFRLIATNKEGTTTINLSRIVSCNVMHEYTDEEYLAPKNNMAEVEFELTDDRNALERVMFHFSHLEKETRKMGNNKYLVW